MFTPVSWHLLRYNDFLFLWDLSWACSERNFPFAPVNGKSKHSAEGIYPLCITQKLNNSVHLAEGVLISSCLIFFSKPHFYSVSRDAWWGFISPSPSQWRVSIRWLLCSFAFFKSIILPHEWYIKVEAEGAAESWCRMRCDGWVLSERKGKGCSSCPKDHCGMFPSTARDFVIISCGEWI